MEIVNDILDSDQWQALLKEIARKQKQLTKMNNVVNNLLILRDKNCPHEELELKERYFSGGYDYCSSTEYWSVCKCCKKTFGKYKEYHGGYE